RETLFVRFADANIGVAAGNAGIFVTKDGGVHWARQEADVVSDGTGAFPLTNGAIVWLSPDRTVVRSRGGLWIRNGSAASWDRVALSENFIDVAFGSEEEGWAVLGRGVYHTSDHGLTWAALTGLPFRHQ